MTNKKKVVSAGYTVEVTSWENDGDNYRTKSAVYSTKEEALAVKHMCEVLFDCTDYDNGSGLGNLMEDEDEEAKQKIVSYLIKNPRLLTIKNTTLGLVSFKESVENEFSEHLIQYTWEECLEEYLEGSAPTAWIDMVDQYNYDLMGGSEYYYSRVCNSVEVYYSAKNVYLDIIEG
jgi:hypothetical protein